ncbi:phospho-N-acetylmuramoyl-pentapeptide-transferase [Waddlia chondrophila]|uniref:Phospho-N-acetylmuramoyl-pentapeptide-transferase n=1 Tax=Waddlia chondrophila (strain ATCC VR-1470 / WSU 86-1044) TaxID=716544 RepID=D6YRP6_WADCW|nr:phospho-N-acetylmuramoyl-pentapeptide-transferase [Waddlia chondrophila]ADI38741.1 phospho-N-acetylmuramoyl-pentapeptide-transferase [Waddlia chondrophila WSU 86-1044]
MILLFLEFLRGHFLVKVPAAFFYTSTRMMLAALTTLFISIFFGPWFIRKLYELKIGQSIRMEECPLLGELHAKKKDTPTMGGLLVLFSMIAALLLWMDLTHAFTLILLISTLVLGFLGGRDDYLKLKYKNTKGLSGKKKLVVQLLLSSFIACYLLVPSVSEFFHVGSWYEPPIVKEEVAGVESSKSISLQTYASRLYLPFFKDPVWTFSGMSLLMIFFLIVFVITGSSNAVNLTDGLDGLAAGCLLMVAVSLSLIAFLSNHLELSQYLNILYIEGSGEIAVFLSGFAGACLGFLWYNGYPAQVFMGDTGSLALGGLIGICAVLLKREFLLAIIGGVFVAEAVSVIVQVGSYKLRNKKRVFLCAPLHHHFEYKGWAETKVVVRFWIISLLLAMIGMLSLKFQ